MTCPECTTGGCIYNATCVQCEVRMVARFPERMAAVLCLTKGAEFTEAVQRERVRLYDEEGIE